MRLLALAGFLCLFLMKLTGNLDWSWPWVFAPIWGGCLAFGLILGATVIFFGRAAQP